MADELKLDSNVKRRIAEKPTLIHTRNRLRIDEVLFRPAPAISYFDYRDVRNFGRDVLADAAQLAPLTETIVITLQGLGNKLDERAKST